MAVDTQKPNLVESLQKSARDTLETMVFLTPSSVEACTAEDRAFSDEVIGLLSFSGTESGTLFVRTSRKLADRMAAKMLMVEPSELGGFEETADAFGEIINMVAGSFKNTFVSDGGQMDLSIPHVVQSGSMHINTALMSGVRLGVRVDIEGMHVDIDMHFQS